MNNKTEQQQKDLEGLWNSLQARHTGLISYPVWQYLQGQNVEALLDYREKFIGDIKLASSLEEKVPQVAFAVRDSEENLVNILTLELDGLLLLASVGKRYRLISSKASIAGASVHFGEPDKVLGLAVSVESAMALVIATGAPCWACLGATGLRSFQVPERVREVRIFSDVEPSGVMEEAALSLSHRLQAMGHTVTVNTPPCAALGLSGKVGWHDAWMVAGTEMLRL